MARNGIVSTKYVSDVTEVATQVPRTGKTWRRWLKGAKSYVEDMVGKESVKVMAKHLRHTVAGIRALLREMRLSGKVRAGKSLCEVRTLLHISHLKALRLIGERKLLTLDMRIWWDDVWMLWVGHRDKCGPDAESRLRALRKQMDRYDQPPERLTWEKAAEYLDVSVDDIGQFVARGNLRVVSYYISGDAVRKLANRYPWEINWKRLTPVLRKELTECRKSKAFPPDRHDNNNMQGVPGTAWQLSRDSKDKSQITETDEDE